MSPEEFRPILGAAHQAVIHGIVLAGQLQNIFIKNEEECKTDDIINHLIAIWKSVEKIQETGRELGKAFAEVLPGSISGHLWVGPVKEYEDTFNRIIALWKELPGIAGIVRKESGEVDNNWYSERLNKNYPERRQRIIAQIPRIEHWKYQNELARVHDEALQRWITLVTVHTVQNTLTREVEEKEPVLSEMQYDILDAIHSLKAFSPDARANAEEIAGKLNLSQVQVKDPISKLVKRWKLLESKTGRGGGVWLTKAGKEQVEKQRKR